MKYAIYGWNRVAKDFRYMFPELEILCYVDDEIDHIENAGDIQLLSLEKFRESELAVDIVIVCGFDKGSKIQKLEQMGYKYKKDYLLEEDFFESLNETSININPENKEIVIWGTGNDSDFFSERFTKFQPKFYIDTYKGGIRFRNREVKFPDDMEDWTAFFVIVAVSRDQEIKQYLNNLGLTEGKDYINANIIMDLPSELLRATIFDQHFYKLNCRTPLNHMELLTGGEIYCCCSTFMRSLGNVKNSNILSIWNAIKHKIICLSVVNRTYTFCNKSMCPLLFGKEQKLVETADYDVYPEMKSSPSVSAIGFDHTCNLKCETCRDEIRIARGAEKEKMLEYARMTVEEILPKTDFLIMAGDGEVFASEAYRSIYKSPNMNHVGYIRLLSNGTLFNPKNWDDFKQNKHGKIMLTASVDAASKETYEEIRRNGNFDVLKANMSFAGELRKKGELAYFRMNFVVQQKNYREMLDFVKWGLKIGADEVFFTKILNWGTYSTDEFREISMMEADGITPKKELREVLDDPLMKNPIVDLGTIQHAHKTTNDVDVENYYMWELERKVGGLFHEPEE